MTIDIHYHFFNEAFHSEKMWEEIAGLCVEFAPAGKPITLEEARRAFVPQMFDTTGERRCGTSMPGVLIKRPFWRLITVCCTGRGNRNQR